VSSLVLNGENLRLEEIAAVARGGVSVSLSPGAVRRVEKAHAVIQRILAGGDQVYGVNTGFGHLKDIRIPPDQLEALQLNLIRSHCAGVGATLPQGPTRALILLRAHVLSRGHSGVRPRVIETLLAFLNADLLPVVPEQGSVGASGDLAPLSHLALGLLGEGEAILGGVRMPAAEALRRSKIEPLRLMPKEGLSLVNGTQLILAIGSLALLASEELAAVADIAGACTRSGHIRDKYRLPPICGSFSKAARSNARTNRAAGCRMPTRCGACPRSTARRATGSGSCAGCWRSRSTR